jgi:hypothetical protein
MCDDRRVAAQREVATEAPRSDHAPDSVIGEPRWPPALALLVFMALNISLRIWLPHEGAVRVPWLVPAIEAVLLAILLVGPATVPEHRRWVRRISVTLVVVLVAAALWATVLLVYDLIKGIGVTDSPTQLLASGALVWLGNNLAFARSRRPDPVDFAFTQQLSPEVAPGWRPVFLDYLHLGFTNATAFSPTDVMPLTLRAKYTMLVQSTVALALFGLIVARAVNAFA